MWRGGVGRAYPFGGAFPLPRLTSPGVRRSHIRLSSDQGANEERDDRRRGDSGSQVVNIALLFGVDGRKIQDDGQLDKLPRLDAVIRNPEPALGIPGHMSDNKQPEQSDDGNEQQKLLEF